MVRGPFYDKNGVKKGAWSKEEDECLSHYIHKHGHSNWRQLPKLAGLARCGKSCRLRWLNHLKPNLKHGNYTREEDEMIIKLHHHLGNKWSLIAEKLPGRTDHEIKNYWHSYLKKCLKSNEFKMLDLKLKPCDIVEENDTHHFVAPKSPISNVGNKDSHYILESSTLSMPAVETSPGDNSCSSTNSREIEEDNVAQWLAFEAFNGDFWTEPFIIEDTSREDNSPSSMNNRGIEEDSVASLLAFEAFNSDFWIEPFVIEDTSPEDNSPSSTNNRRIEEDSVAPLLAFEAFSDDFWTEPFVIEDTSPEDNSPISTNNRRIEEDSDAPLLAFEAFNDDFWTEPFVIEDTSPKDNSPSSTNNRGIEEDNAAPLLAFEAFSGDFWTEPFGIEDTSPEDNLPSSTNSHRIEEDSVAPWLAFKVSIGDFWTEPFIIEDTYTTNEISNKDIDLLISDFYDGSYMF